MKKFILTSIFINLMISATFATTRTFARTRIKENYQSPVQSEVNILNLDKRKLEELINQLNTKILKETSSKTMPTLIYKTWNNTSKTFNSINNIYNWMADTIYDSIFTKKGILKTGLIVLSLYPVINSIHPIKLSHLILDICAKYGQLKGTMSHIIELNKQIGALQGFWSNARHHTTATISLTASEIFNWITKNAADLYMKKKIK